MRGAILGIAPKLVYSVGEPNWNTPIIRLQIESDKHHCSVYGKLETVNPTSVHKDRESAMVMLDMKGTVLLNLLHKHWKRCDIDISFCVHEWIQITYICW